MNSTDTLESFNIPKGIKLEPIDTEKARVRVFVGKAWGEHLGLPTSSRRQNKRRGELMLTALGATLAVVALASCAAEAAPAPACSIVIHEGDTLDAIASGQQSVVADLYEANGNNASITPGQVLYLGESACSTLEAAGVFITPTPRS